MNKYLNLKKSYIFVLFMLFLFFPLSSSFSKEKINIGYFSLEPHTISENNKHLGAIIEFWEKYIAPEMNVELNWRGPLPPLRLFKSLENGEVNVIALLAKNPDRVKIFDFPNESFFIMEAGIAVTSDSKLNKINSVNDLFSLNLGFFQDGFIPPTLRDKRIKWNLVPATDWQTTNFNKLIAKRIDAAFNPESLSLIYEAKRLNIKNKVKILVIPNTKSELYSVFTKKDNGKYLKKYNQIISDKGIKEKYLGLLQKYIK
ncbi:MAG: transporter substrate-binding domain-containing protein [Spirochaetota bacterium]